MDLDSETRESLEQDFKHILNYVTLDFDGKGTRCLVIFSSSKQNFWQVYRLPQPVKSRLIVSNEPYVRPLTTLLDEYKRYCTVVVSRDKARIFEVYLGEITEHTDIFSEVPGKVRIAGWYGLEERRIERHIDDQIHRHLKQVADATLNFFKEKKFDWLIIGGKKETLTAFERHLHSYLQERIVGRIDLEPDASLHEALARTQEIARRVEREEEQALIQRLMDEANSNGLGVLGLEDTLKAVWQGQVNTLILKNDLTVPGYVCPKCGYMSVEESECPIDQIAMTPTPDILEEAVESAILQNCQIEHVMESQELDNVGGIGAILRFKL
jgi:peptide subunit release factor 1 (eRF1)